MTPYQIQGPTRRCAGTGRELKAGEAHYSVLIEEGGQFVRKDYAVDAWDAPPEGVIAYWRGRIPTESRQTPVFNDDLLLECFTHLGDAKEPGQRQFRYVVALLLMRRKRLKFEDVRRRDGDEYLCLKDGKSGMRYEVLDPHLTDAEMTTVQNEVFRVLGWE
jgi:hypothetical protein